MTLDHERELPCQVVRILQPGIHALAAHRAVHVRRVAEQEATQVAELLRGPVMDAVDGEPAAFLEGQFGPRLPSYIGTQLRERDVVPPSQLLGEDADHPPAVLAAHREEQVKSVAPQVDVQLFRHHGPGRLGIGDEEHVLVRRAGKGDAGKLAYRAVPAVAARDIRGLDLAGGAIGLLERCDYATGFLGDAGELGVPLHRHAPVAQVVAHDPLVVVLAQHQDKGKRADALPDVAQRDARRPLSFRPHIGAVAAAAQLERTLRDPELGVDLERTRMHRHRPRLLRRPGMPVYDHGAYAAPSDLVGEHQPGGAASDDQYVRIHLGRGPADYI